MMIIIIMAASGAYDWRPATATTTTITTIAVVDAVSVQGTKQTTENCLAAAAAAAAATCNQPTTGKCAPEVPPPQ